MPSKKKPAAAPRRPARAQTPPPPPSRDQTAYLQAVAAFQAGTLGEATRLAEQAANLNPHRADVFALLAVCWTRRGDQTRALECAQRTTELEPANPVWWNRLGQTNLELRRFDQAKNAYLRAISADSANSDAYYQLAKAEMHLGEAQAAADHLVQALTLRGELAADARRDFPSLASHPTLADWLAPEKPASSRRSAKPRRR